MLTIHLDFIFGDKTITVVDSVKLIDIEEGTGFVLNDCVATLEKCSQVVVLKRTQLKTILTSSNTEKTTGTFNRIDCVFVCAHNSVGKMVQGWIPADTLKPVR